MLHLHPEEVVLGGLTSVDFFCLDSVAQPPGDSRAAVTKNEHTHVLVPALEHMHVGKTFRISAEQEPVAGEKVLARE